MRLAAITVGSLLFAGLTSGKASVEVLNVEPSFQHVRILTLHNGNPLERVRLDVFSWNERRRLSISTNKEGVAKFSLSPPGRYRIAANAANGLGADLVLDVSKGIGKNESSFTLNLAVRPPPPPTLDERVVAAEAAGGAEIRQFAGHVVDPAGNVVPQTKLEVFKKGSRGKGRRAKTESDASGHFFAHLSDGSYTAVFSAQGFSTYIGVFEIAKGDDSADAAGLRIVLQNGPIT
jgi:Carboxypeptidase regulatory-like domain